MSASDVSASDLYDDAELYDAQYRWYRDDVPFYRDLALDRPGAVLEIGAGTGRVTVELARLAERVVAVEPSASMRAAAAARLDEAGVADRVELRDQDARELDENGGFALVVAPFHVLMHFLTLDDQDAVLRAARSALDPGGAFACDLFVPRFEADGVLRREATWRDAAGRDAELWTVQHHHAARQRIESLYLVDRVGDDGVVRRSRRTLVQRYFHRYELERAVRSAGFRDVRLFGDFDRRPLDDDATRYVLLATT